MEEKRNNRNVEKRLKDALKDDRGAHPGRAHLAFRPARDEPPAHPRQRPRVDDPDLPVCNGNGFIRSSSSLALHVLRSIEEHLQKHGTHDLIVKVPTATALYVLNEKRSTLDELERTTAFASSSKPSKASATSMWRSSTAPKRRAA